MGAGERKGLFCLALALSAQLPWLLLSPATCRAKSPLTKPTQANLSRGRLAELAGEAGFRMGQEKKPRANDWASWRLALTDHGGQEL
jgi:hypothetical protein